MHKGMRVHYVHRYDEFFPGYHKVSSGSLQSVYDNEDGTKSYGIQNERGKHVVIHQDNVHTDYSSAKEHANKMTKEQMKTEAIAQGDWHVIDDESNQIHSTHPTYRKAMNKMNKLNQDPATEHKGTANKYSISSADYYEKTKGNLSRQVKQKVSEQENQEMTQDQISEAPKFDDGESVGKPQSKKRKQNFEALRKQKRDAAKGFAEAVVFESLDSVHENFKVLMAIKMQEKLDEMREAIAEDLLGEGCKLPKFKDGDDSDEARRRKQVAKIIAAKKQVGRSAKRMTESSVDEAVSPLTAHNILTAHGVKPGDSFFEHGDDVTSRIAGEGRKLGIKHNASSRAAGKSENRHIFDRLSSIASKHSDDETKRPGYAAMQSALGKRYDEKTGKWN